MARGFAVFTDNHVQQAVVDGLLRAEWDVVRAIDVFRGEPRTPCSSSTRRERAVSS